MPKRWLYTTCIASYIFLGLCGYFLSPGPLSFSGFFSVNVGESTSSVVHNLYQSGFIRSPTIFKYTLRLLGADRHLKAGEYVYTPYSNPLDIAYSLIRGTQYLFKVSIPEGLTNAQVLALLHRLPFLKKDIAKLPKEGTLYPATYYVMGGTPISQCIQRMHMTMLRKLEKVWSIRHKGLPLQSSYDALILASIVEKETALSKERPRIAAVFLNRLRHHMHLNADPTIIYALTRGNSSSLGRKVSAQDLKYLSPYNTYKFYGLPPTAICNASYTSLKAVLFPSLEPSILYFVFDPSLKEHVFSSSLSAHNRHIRRLR